MVFPIQAKTFLIFLFLILPYIKSDFTSFDSLYPQVVNLIAHSETYSPPFNNGQFWAIRSSNNVTSEILNYGVFDFIIVGGGTAGGVLANRLTEEKFTVLVIEAGPPTPDVAAILGLNLFMGKTEWNWGYRTTPQTNACLAFPNHQCGYDRGKTLGGCSSINEGLYTRGNAEDFNQWEKLGNPGWSYYDVLPYFKKSEYANFTGNQSIIDAEYHGFSGLQTIEIAEDDPSGITQVLADGFRELRQSEVDYNGKTQIGYSRLQNYESYNIRAGSNYSFFRPAINRPNLHVIYDSLVTKIGIVNKTAIGVEFIRDGQKYYANASKEILLSAGAINTPQVLMLSGIGPADHLNDLGIDVVADLPVGKYFQEQMAATITFKINLTFPNYTLADQLNLWFEDKRAWNVGFSGQMVSFWSLDDDERPEIEIFTAAPVVDNTASAEFNGTMILTLLHPTSVGSVTLASNDPKDFPLINPNSFSTQKDLDDMYKGLQIVFKLFNTTAFKKLNAELYPELIPACEESYERLSEQWWHCEFEYISIMFLHPTGVTRMGPNATGSVVDTNLKVHGIEKLRVVDAGVIPATFSGHTQAPTTMIAEKISDIIKKQYRNDGNEHNKSYCIRLSLRLYKKIIKEFIKRCNKEIFNTRG